MDVFLCTVHATTQPIVLEDGTKEREEGAEDATKTTCLVVITTDVTVSTPERNDATDRWIVPAALTRYHAVIQ